MNTFMIKSNGAVLRHVPDGTWAGSTAIHGGPIPEGSVVEYWRCGDQMEEHFEMPPIGGVVRLRHVGRGDKQFGPHIFKQIEFARFTKDTAIGDVPDSGGRWRRES